MDYEQYFHIPEVKNKLSFYLEKINNLDISKDHEIITNNYTIINKWYNNSRLVTILNNKDIIYRAHHNIKYITYDINYELNDKIIQYSFVDNRIKMIKFLDTNRIEYNDEGPSYIRFNKNNKVCNTRFVTIKMDKWIEKYNYSIKIKSSVLDFCRKRKISLTGIDWSISDKMYFKLKFC